MPVIPQKNDKAIDANRAHYVKLYAPTTTLGNIVSMNLEYPGLRGYWPLHQIDEVYASYDYSGQGRALHCPYQDVYCPELYTDGLSVYMNFIRASSYYLYRHTENGLAILENLTFGCWVRFDAESTDQNTGIISKWFSGDDNRSYLLYKNNLNAIIFKISNTGADEFSVSDGGNNYAEDQWFYISGRFTPSAELKLFVNGNWYSNVVSIPSDIYNSEVNFEIGRYNDENNLDGRVAHAYISAYSVPDLFINSMYSHSKALFMSKLN
jgi:hypothetical protein